MSVHKVYTQGQINKRFQKIIFQDLLRHYYRNFIILNTLKIKLETADFNSYPSEEHILKFKSLPEDLRINKFTTSGKNYDSLHEFELLLRNINVEIDVFLDHLKNKDLNKEIKLRDFNTMFFKFSMIAERITRILKDLKYKGFNSTEHFYAYLKQVSEENAKRKKSVPPSIDSQRMEIESRKENFFDQLGLGKELDNDIKLEFDVLQLIPFYQTTT
ncbi:hypothetical protein Belba_1576 [Belliella baltica DSM 15883]|uniref:Uncharacterized protein n=1 Tax=Belliella baltica (strain DSM 15883 / CIP 108006 / LMG 21964 / BA134) TaxID=866536 RepID=I3Z4L8_BELBD|nr:hypothetical protein [Belliella baltica]AFL84186.1 hypothetical protein Belba_1576 [Belliella baltica DSM 15883]